MAEKIPTHFIGCAKVSTFKRTLLQLPETKIGGATISPPKMAKIDDFRLKFVKISDFESDSADSDGWEIAGNGRKFLRTLHWMR